MEQETERHPALQWWAQVEQRWEAQLAHPPPAPATAWVWPLLLRLKVAKVENTREVCKLSQWRQEIGLSAWLMLRSASNLVWQSAQTYSYSGITYLQVRTRVYFTALLQIGQLFNDNKEDKLTC
jgi:hypothetical protein